MTAVITPLVLISTISCLVRWTAVIGLCFFCIGTLAIPPFQGFFQRSLRISEGYDGSIGDFVRDPHFGLEKILRFNLAWFSYCLDQESACSTRVLSYEALRRDPERGLSQLCFFLVPERKVGERQIQKVIAQTSFERMQAKEKAGAFAKKYSKALTPGDSSNVESFKVRRGKVGGFADYFTGDDLSFADQLMARYD